MGPDSPTHQLCHLGSTSLSLGLPSVNGTWLWFPHYRLWQVWEAVPHLVSWSQACGESLFLELQPQCQQVAYTEHLTSRALGLVGAPQGLESHTCPQKASERSSFPGCCPRYTFPPVWLPTPCSGPGLSPVQNGDFVWHLVLGTLLSLFLGTGPAQQVCKGMTHAQTPRESAIFASGSCHVPTSLPPLPPQEVSPFPSPQVVSKGKTSQEVFTCPLHLPMMRMTSFLPQ